MATIKTINQLAATTNISEKLIRAVVRQVGGWDSFKEIAQDVTRHGADAGFGQFVYYVDTCKFYANNRTAIIELANEMASSLGEDVLTMIRGFNCLGNDYSLEEVGQTLYGNRNKHQTQVANALAWFALEEVSRAYSDALEG